MRVGNFFPSGRCRLLPLHGYRAKQVRQLLETAHQPVKNSKDEPFRYTSGRWMYVFIQPTTASRLTHYSDSEHFRLAERYLQSDIPALMKVVAAASGHGMSDIVSFYKMAKGGFNRLFQATFTDQTHVIARLPYPSTLPTERKVPLPNHNNGDFCIGPMAHYS